MRNFEFDELIEKAFSMGYEYALMEQREFGAVKKENKRKKREWLKKLGREKGWNWENDDNNGGLHYFDGYIAGKRAADKTEKGKSWKIDFDGDDVSAGRLLRKRNEDDSSSLNNRINRKGSQELNQKGKQRFVGKNSEKRDQGAIDRINRRSIENRKWDAKMARDKSIQEEQENAEKIFEAKRRLENIKDIRKKKNIKKAAAILGTGALVGTAAYGIKKYRDNRKAEKEERRRLEEENKALKEALELKNKNK